MVGGRTGVFFDRPVVDDISRAVDEMVRADWRASDISAHAELFSEERFAARLHEIVEEELARGRR